MTAYFDKTQNKGLKHLINATRFSLRGLTEAVKRESAFRQELALMVLLIPVGVWVAGSWTDFVVLMAVSMMVLVVELLNSGIEAAVDRVGVEHHEMAGLAKDYGSAAVMLALIAAGLVWATYIVQHFS